MQESSLVKWVDELQGQIDQIKRSIPAPAPTPEPEDPQYVVYSGSVAMTVTFDGTLALAVGTIDEDLDLTKYDYYLDIHYQHAGGSDTYIADVLHAKIAADPAIRYFGGTKFDNTVVTPLDFGYCYSPLTAEGVVVSLHTPITYYSDEGTENKQYVITGIKKPAAQSRNKTKKK